MPAEDQGVTVSLRRKRYTLVPRTLCFVTHGRDVLLLKGAADKRIYPGKYNGVGGHVERDEDVGSAARREIREETGLRVGAVQLCGVVNIDAGQEAGIGLFVFRAEADTRGVHPSDEGTLEWASADQIEHLDLVEDLPVILPRVLSMRRDDPPFLAHYSYDEQGQLVISFLDTERG